MKAPSDVHSVPELAAALALVMQRNDRQLLRTPLQILRNREDAEDAVPSAYLNALAGISGFAGRPTLLTWLTRIVTNAALAHARLDRRRQTLLEESTSIVEIYCETLMRGSIPGSPERAYARHHILLLINDAIDQFHTVFVLRQIEELDVGEVAEMLGINTATVRPGTCVRGVDSSAPSPLHSGGRPRARPCDCWRDEPVHHHDVSLRGQGSQGKSVVAGLR